MGLHAEMPAWIPLAIVDCQLRIFKEISPVHRLQIEMVERESFELARLRVVLKLWEHQF